MMTSNFVNGFISLCILTFLEVVLGIDNLVFIAIASNKLPTYLQKKARRIGLSLAWMTRLLLLGTALALASLTKPLFTVMDFAVSIRDIILFGGGLFLLVKATMSIHEEVESSLPQSHHTAPPSFLGTIIQIAILDIVFSLDSVITAIGLTDHFFIMAAAITIAILVMILASEPLTRFINKHPTVKMLAMSFLLLVGVMLVADGLHFYIPRGYIYFAIAFSLLVEALNAYARKKKR